MAEPAIGYFDEDWDGRKLLNAGRELQYRAFDSGTTTATRP